MITKPRKGYSCGEAEGHEWTSSALVQELANPNQQSCMKEQGEYEP